jgi:hypothetical protein
MTRLNTLVELVHAYSNLLPGAESMLRLRVKASSPRPAGGPKRPRQNQRHLRESEVEELIKEYEEGAMVKELAQRFSIHRLTVTAILRRHGVKLRRAGIAPEEVPAAARLYRQGWSLPRLGERYGVDTSTVRRALRIAGVVMRPHRQSR